MRWAAVLSISWALFGCDSGGMPDAGFDAGPYVCAPSAESCARAPCCEGLACCSGVPVPQGEEYCAPIGECPR